MTNDSETTMTPPSFKPTTPSAGAARMRAFRERQRLGLRSIWVQLRATEVAELVRRGLLKEEKLDDYIAVRDAVHRHLDLTLSKQS
jgi:hypothetical protein